MKKIILFVLASVSCFSYFSCTKDISEVDDSQAFEYSQILTKMSSFNDSLLSIKPQTRSTNSFIRNLSIVCADVVGGYSGGKTAFELCPKVLGPNIVGTVTGVSAVVCGAWSSYKVGRVWGVWSNTRAVAITDDNIPLRLMSAYAPIREDEKQIFENRTKLIRIDMPEDMQELYSIGPKHNIVLNNLLSNDGITQNCKKYFTPEEIIYLESEEFVRANDSICNSICRLLNSGEIPITDGKDISSLLINLFTQILAQYPDDADDVQFVIKKYTEAVRNSKEIPDDEKMNIYSALSVAASSYEYWNLNQ